MSPPDDAEFAELYRVEFPRVARIAALVSGSHATGEEIAQDAFGIAWDKWRTVRAAERPGAWVQTVAARLAVRRARRDETRGVLHRRIHDAAAAEIQLSNEAGSDLALDVRRALASLAPKERLAVALVAIDDASTAELAAALDCSESTARSHLNRGRKRLAVLLSPEVIDAH